LNVLKTLTMRALRAARSSGSDPRAVAVLAPESLGSVGDQAMLEVMREQLTARGLKPTFIYMPNWTISPLREDAPTVMLKSNSKFAPQFWQTIVKTNAMVLVGADVIDGVYDNWLPFQWIGKLTQAKKAGAKVGIVNFSFSPEADSATCERLRIADGFTFTPRDPVSCGRFVASTGQSATLSADLAFLLTPEIRSANAYQANQWLGERKAAGDTVLFVNLSGHTLSRMRGNGTTVMEGVLRQWLQASAARSIFLVPHDFRPAPTGDVEALEQLRASLAAEFPNRITMIYPPFAAWDVKALCEQADLAISGRMHLSIACLGMGVPVISVVYVGKFEGLMQHLELADEDLLVSTAEALETDLLLSKIERVTSERQRLSDHIRSRLVSVRALSAKNFDWL
jgi:polysaccharide pyruvyl transferase WcaK-like protein